MTDETSYVRSSSKVLESYLDRGWAKLDFTDDVLAKQFYSLSFQDRNAISEEIHGVRSMACEETSELIESSLRLLEIELQNLPLHYKIIYQKASSMVICASNKRRDGGSDDLVEDMVVDNEAHFDDDLFANLETLPPSDSSSCYVRSRDFQLAFLRCEYFNTKKAAIRLVKYLELAYELYGEEALRRPLRIDDFKSKEEKEVLNAGHQQLLPFRDRSGRRVLALHGDLNLPSSSLMARSVLSKGPAMKLLLYMWSVLLEDVDAQRRGLVVVFWPRYVDHRINQSSSEIDSEEATSPSGKSRRRRRRGSQQRAKRRPKKVSQDSNVDSNIDDINGDLSILVPDADSRSTGMRFFDAIPVRACAIHCCLPDTPFFRMIRHVLLMILGETFRTRVKTHQGEFSEMDGLVNEVYIIFAYSLLIRFFIAIILPKYYFKSSN